MLRVSVASQEALGRTAKAPGRRESLCPAPVARSQGRSPSVPVCCRIFSTGRDSLRFTKHLSQAALPLCSHLGMRGALSPLGVDPLSSEGCEQPQKAGDDFFTMAPDALSLGHCWKPGIVSLFWGNYYVTRKHWSPQASVQMSGPHEVKHLASLMIHGLLLGFSLFLPSFFSSSSSLFTCFAWVDSNGPPSWWNDLHPRPQEIWPHKISSPSF